MKELLLQLATIAPVNVIRRDQRFPNNKVSPFKNITMKPHRVTIKYKKGEQTNLISTVVPAVNEKDAIDKVIEANGIAEVVSKKAELLK